LISAILIVLDVECLLNALLGTTHLTRTKYALPEKKIGFQDYYKIEMTSVELINEETELLNDDKFV